MYVSFGLWKNVKVAWFLPSGLIGSTEINDNGIGQNYMRHLDYGSMARQYTVLLSAHIKAAD